MAVSISVLLFATRGNAAGESTRANYVWWRD